MFGFSFSVVSFRFLFVCCLLIGFSVCCFLRQTLWSPECPRVHYVEQAGLEITDIGLPLPPRAAMCVPPLQDQTLEFC